MDKKVIQTPLMKMLDPLYQYKHKQDEERDFQAIRMYRMKEGSTVCNNKNLVGTDIFLIEEQRRQEDEKFKSDCDSSSKQERSDPHWGPFRRDVEAIRVIKRYHQQKVTKVIYAFFVSSVQMC